MFIGVFIMVAGLKPIMEGIYTETFLKFSNNWWPGIFCEAIQRFDS